MTESMAQVVKETTGAQRILLFGSRVNGNVCNDSDHDVLVVLEHSVGRKERFRLASRCRRRLAQAGVVYILSELHPEPPSHQAGKMLAVVYKEISREDSFVITAFLSRELNWLRKRNKLWP